MGEPASTIEAATPLTLGDMFGGTFRAWAAGFARTVLISLLFYAPVIALGWLALRGNDASSLAASGWNMLRTVLLMAASMLVSAAVVFGAVQDRRQVPASIGRCVGAAFSSFWTLLGMSILVGLLAMLFMLPLGIVFGILIVARNARTRPTGGPGNAAEESRSPHLLLRSDVGLYVALLAVASSLVATIVQARYLVAPASILAERRGVSDSMRDSSRLTAGHRTTLWALLAILSLAIAAVSLALQWTVEDPAVGEALLLGFQAVVATPLSACAAAVAYEELKRRKDGVDVATLGKIFD